MGHPDLDQDLWWDGGCWMLVDGWMQRSGRGAEVGGDDY